MHLERALERAAGLLPDDWGVTTSGSLEAGLIVAVKMRYAATVKTFPPGSSRDAVTFLERLGREYDARPKPVPSFAEPRSPVGPAWGSA
jgi:hypothetical protein